MKCVSGPSLTLVTPTATARFPRQNGACASGERVSVSWASLGKWSAKLCFSAKTNNITSGPLGKNYKREKKEYCIVIKKYFKELLKKKIFWTINCIILMLIYYFLFYYFILSYHMCDLRDGLLCHWFFK